MRRLWRTISWPGAVRSLACTALAGGLLGPAPLQAQCYTHESGIEDAGDNCILALAPAEEYVPPVLFLKPRETIKVDREVVVMWSVRTQALSPDLRFSWVAFPTDGTATPATGEKSMACRKGRHFSLTDTIGFSYTAPAAEGLYVLPVAVTLNPDSASAAGIPPSCRALRDDWTVIVGGAEYGVTIIGQYTEPGGARAGLSVRGTFGIDPGGKVSGQAIHENWILGECVQYRDSMPQKIDGWIEDKRIHLRFNKAGEATATTNNVDDKNASCLFKGLRELGTLLAMAGSDVVRQAGDGRTSTATLPGGLELPGEVTYPVLRPGQLHIQKIGNLRYSIRRRK